MSLPVRERGLKPKWQSDGKCARLSLPVRERGLKPWRVAFALQADGVAPRAGAWIETVTLVCQHHLVCVAPRAGAWIETNSQISPKFIHWSLPVRERGLKPQIVLVPDAPALVAPRAGAWIETRARLDILVAECGRSPCGSADICEGKFYTSNMLDLGVDRCGRDVKNSVSMASTVLG